MSDPGTLDGQHPLELAAISTTMVATTAAAAALFPAADTLARLVVVATAVGACAALATRARTAVYAAGLGYLLFVGFLVNTHGELTWDGTASLWHLSTIGTATGAGLLCRALRAARAEAAFDADLQRLLDQNEPTGTDDRHHPR